MNSACPICKSENITGGRIDTDEGFCWQRVSCEDCESEWQEVYTFSCIDNIRNNKKEIA